MEPTEGSLFNLADSCRGSNLLCYKWHRLNTSSARSNIENDWHYCAQLKECLNTRWGKSKPINHWQESSLSRNTIETMVDLTNQKSQKKDYTTYLSLWAVPHSGDQWGPDGYSVGNFSSLQSQSLLTLYVTGLEQGISDSIGASSVESTVAASSIAPSSIVPSWRRLRPSAQCA